MMKTQPYKKSKQASNKQRLEKEKNFKTKETKRITDGTNISKCHFLFGF